MCLCIILLIANCSCKRDDFDSIVAREWKKCNGSSNCIVDFAFILNFDWDTMCFYSGACSLDEINKDLGFKLKEFTDIGDRIIFLKNGKVVYQKEWFPIPSKPPEGTIFKTDLKKFRVNKSDSKFILIKEGKAFFLTKL